MNYDTYLDRLEGTGFIKKNGEKSLVLIGLEKDLCDLMNYYKQRDGKFHFFSWQNYSNLRGESRYYNMIRLLEALKINFSIGNDAPRGGKEGDFIYIRKTELNKIPFLFC